MLHVQLPAAGSLEQTEEVLKKVEGILARTEGVRYYTGIGGFSLLNRISASYQGFFFMSFKLGCGPLTNFRPRRYSPK